MSMHQIKVGLLAALIDQYFLARKELRDTLFWPSAAVMYLTRSRSCWKVCARSVTPMFNVDLSRPRFHFSSHKTWRLAFDRPIYLISAAKGTHPIDLKLGHAKLNSPSSQASRIDRCEAIGDLHYLRRVRFWARSEYSFSFWHSALFSSRRRASQPPGSGRLSASAVISLCCRSAHGEFLLQGGLCCLVSSKSRNEWRRRRCRGKCSLDRYLPNSWA